MGSQKENGRYSKNDNISKQQNLQRFSGDRYKMKITGNKYINNNDEIGMMEEESPEILTTQNLMAHDYRNSFNGIKDDNDEFLQRAAINDNGQKKNTKIRKRIKYITA